MTEASCTLTIPDLSHDGANLLAATLEEDIRIDPLAIIINEKMLKNVGAGKPASSRS